MPIIRVSKLEYEQRKAQKLRARLRRQEVYTERRVRQAYTYVAELRDRISNLVVENQRLRDRITALTSAIESRENQILILRENSRVLTEQVETLEIRRAFLAPSLDFPAAPLDASAND